MVSKLQLDCALAVAVPRLALEDRHLAKEVARLEHRQPSLSGPLPLQDLDLAGFDNVHEVSGIPFVEDRRCGGEGRQEVGGVFFRGPLAGFLLVGFLGGGFDHGGYAV